MAVPLSVSVVIPTYQRAHLLSRAMRSVLAEIGASDELIIVDDGSTDSTKEVVSKLSDARVRYVWQPNSGAGSARNRGAREARGDLLAYLDSDDEWLAGKLYLQRSLMTSRSDILFCFTNFAREYGGKRHHRDITSWHPDKRTWHEIVGPPEPFSCIAKLPEKLPDFLFYVGNIYRGEMSANYILTSCLMIRRVAAGDAVRFTEGVTTYEDWECFGRLSRQGSAAFMDIETAVQHAHPGSRLTDADQFACAESRLVVLRNVWGSDPEFLQSYGKDYWTLISHQERLKLRTLFALGRMREARKEIREMQTSPGKYRAIALVPPGILAWAIRTRKSLRNRCSCPDAGSKQVV